MSIRIYGATSGYVDLDAPAVAGSASVTLPGSGTLALYSQLKVLQVVSATYATQVEVATTSYTDSGLTATITPSSTSSKVLVLVNQGIRLYRLSAEQGAGIRLLRGSTVIYDPVADATGPYDYYSYYGTATTQVGFYTKATLTVIDSPATTSATTYKTSGRPYQTADSGHLRMNVGGTTSTMVLMEIAA